MADQHAQDESIPIVPEPISSTDETAVSQVLAAPLRERDPRTIGGWKLLGRLGEGGMGIVYLAEKSGLRTALKAIRSEYVDNPEFRTRFLREVELLQSVDSVHIARCIEAGLQNDPPFVATEFAPGITLKDYVLDFGPLDADQVETIGLALAKGLADIHAAGVTHRDLKPSNVLLTPSGPIIIDFGIAVATEGTSITKTGRTVGSPGWMSPEQVAGDAATAASDSFSWASVVQFAATGASPFGQGRPEAMLYRVLNAEPAPHNIGGRLGELVTAALTKDPLGRPAASTVVASLESAEPVTQINALERLDLPTGVVLPAPAPRPTSKRIILVLSLLALLVGATTVISLMMRNNPASNVQTEVPENDDGAGSRADDSTGDDSKAVATGPDTATFGELQRCDHKAETVVAGDPGGTGPFEWRQGRVQGGADNSAFASASTMRQMVTLTDGRIAGVTFDDRLVVWDPQQPDVAARAFPAHTATTWRLVALADGRVAVGSDEGAVRVFDPDQEGTDPVRLDWHSTEVTAMLGLCDGRLVTAAKFSRTIVVWDVDGGDFVRLEDPEGEIRAMAELPDGRVIIGAGNGELRIWDPSDTSANPASLQRVQGGPILDIEILDNGWVVALNAAAQLQVWDVDSPNLPVSVWGRSDRERWGAPIAAVPESRLVIGLTEGEAVLWDPAEDSTTALVAGDLPPGADLAYGDQILTLTVLDDGRVVGGSTDGIVRVWETDPTLIDNRTIIEPVVVIENAPGSSSGVPELVSARSRFVSADDAFRTWDVATLMELDRRRMSPISAMAVADGRVVTGHEDGRAHLWTADGARLDLLEQEWAITAAAISKDGGALNNGRLAIASGADLRHRIRLYDMEGQAGRTYVVSSPVTSLALLDGGRIIAGTEDGQLILLGGGNGNESLANGPMTAITDIVELPDGRIAVAADESTIWIYDRSDPSAVAQIEHPFGSPSPMTLVGDLLATGGGSGRVRLWDIDKPDPSFEVLETEVAEISHLGTTGTELVVVDERGAISWWDAREQTRPSVELLAGTGIVASGDGYLAFNDNGGDGFGVFALAE